MENLCLKCDKFYNRACDAEQADMKINEQLNIVDCKKFVPNPKNLGIDKEEADMIIPVLIGVLILVFISWVLMFGFHKPL